MYSKEDKIIDLSKDGKLEDNDLAGKTLVLGSRQAAEATVLPVHFLRRQGVNFDRIKIHSLDGNADLRGNPCSSEVHVLAALREGKGQAGIIGERFWKHLSEREPQRVHANVARTAQCIFAVSG